MLCTDRLHVDRTSEFGHLLAITLFISLPSKFSVSCPENHAETVPVGNCKALGAAVSTCAAVSIAATTFLFLLRVRVIYLRSRQVTMLFGAIWVITQALSVLDAQSVRGGEPVLPL